MAFNIDPNISLSAKPPQQMSLSDMMNIAIGAQKYKQAEQINPLLAREQQAVTTEAEQTLQPKIDLKTMEAQKAGVELKQHYTNVARGLLGGFVLDSDFINGNSEKMVEKIKGAKYYAEKVLKIPADVLADTDRLIDMAQTKPNETYQAIKNGIIQSGQNTAQTNLVTPKIENINGIPYSYTPATNVAVPAGTGGQAPQVPPPTVTAEQLSKPEFSQPAKLQYPVRDPSKPYAPLPTEAEDTKYGNVYRTALVNNQSTLSQTKGNFDALIGKISDVAAKHGDDPGLTGKWAAEFKNWSNDAEYKELSKDLANAQIGQIKTQGGSLDTVAGQQLLKLANGDVTYPPKTLAAIAYRAKSDTYNQDMQATGAQKFAQKYGDNNMKSYQTMWNKNADNRIFQVMAVSDNPKLSKEQKQSEVAKIIGTNDKQVKMFYEKYKNIKKLTQDGIL